LAFSGLQTVAVTLQDGGFDGSSRVLLGRQAAELGRKRSVAVC
jgi:hypothetical protein